MFEENYLKDENVLHVIYSDNTTMGIYQLDTVFALI